MDMIRFENMSSIYKLEETDIHVSWVLKHFLEFSDEVLYFTDHGILKAVISIGDLFRYLEGGKRELLNRSFTQVSEEDTASAQQFFSEQPTIHELPLVDASGRFAGIIKSGESNSEEIWESFRIYAKALYYHVELYYESCAAKFMKAFKGLVFLVDLPDDKEAAGRLKTREEKETYALRHAAHPLELLGNMAEQEEKCWWRELYKPGISSAFAREFGNMDISDINGCKYYKNNETSQYITFDQGKRSVPNADKTAGNKIFLAGPCTAFGAYVADSQTVEYYLQELVNGNYPYQVVNFGALGPYYEFQYLLTEKINQGDVVIIASNNQKLSEVLREYDRTRYLGDYSDIFDDMENPLSCILDTFRHVNCRVSEKIAERLYHSIELYLKLSGKEEKEPAFPIQNYFIPWDVVVYYKDFALNYNFADLKGNVGAAVMNCNPFTKGHRYLIEYAASKVDTLIVFVVEEDASAFSFEDRIAMVRLGTEDIANVTVVPSGRYNISKSTFAQYFEKDMQIEQIESMEYDLRIFCEVIADCMNISCRFVGEEPNDLVTKQYNETMKEVLPQYGIGLVEIPRLCLEGDNEDCISASKVRRFMERKNWGQLSRYLPPTTVAYMKEKELCPKFQ